MRCGAGSGSPGGYETARGAASPARRSVSVLASRLSPACHFFEWQGGKTAPPRFSAIFRSPSLPSARSNCSPLCFAAGVKLWQRDEAHHWFTVCQPVLLGRVFSLGRSVDGRDGNERGKGPVYLAGTGRNRGLRKLPARSCVLPGEPGGAALPGARRVAQRCWRCSQLSGGLFGKLLQLLGLARAKTTAMC